MSTFNATEARSKLYALMDEVAETHQPITITGKRGNAVLLSEQDWNAINETLYLLSMPGMRESIMEGMEADLDKCSQRRLVYQVLETEKSIKVLRLWTHYD